MNDQVKPVVEDQVAPATPVVEEEDFLSGSTPACNLGEECESCT